MIIIRGTLKSKDMCIHTQEENNPFEVEGLFCFPTKRRPRTQIGWENFLGLATLLYSHALQLPLMPPQEKRVGWIEMVFFIDNKQRKRLIDQDRKQLLEFSRDKRPLSKNTKGEMGNKEKTSDHPGPLRPHSWKATQLSLQVGYVAEVGYQPTRKEDFTVETIDTANVVLRVPTDAAM